MVELGCWAGKDRHHANGPTPPAAQRERDRCQARRLPDRPGANKVVGTIPVGAESHSVAIGGEGVWAPSFDEQTVYRIDPDARRRRMLAAAHIRCHHRPR